MSFLLRNPAGIFAAFHAGRVWTFSVAQDPPFRIEEGLPKDCQMWVSRAEYSEDDWKLGDTGGHYLTSWIKGQNPVPVCKKREDLKYPLFPAFQLIEVEVKDNKILHENRCFQLEEPKSLGAKFVSHHIEKLLWEKFEIGRDPGYLNGVEAYEVFVGLDRIGIWVDGSFSTVGYLTSANYIDGAFVSSGTGIVLVRKHEIEEAIEGVGSGMIIVKSKGFAFVDAERETVGYCKISFIHRPVYLIDLNEVGCKTKSPIDKLVEKLIAIELTKKENFFESKRELELHSNQIRGFWSWSGHALSIEYSNTSPPVGSSYFVNENGRRVAYFINRMGSCTTMDINVAFSISLLSKTSVRRFLRRLTFDDAIQLIAEFVCDEFLDAVLKFIYCGEKLSKKSEAILRFLMDSPKPLPLKTDIMHV
jgi:hypothetical protein